MSWSGTNTWASWNPGKATGGGGSDVGILVNTPTEPQTPPIINPTLTLVGRNTIPYPTEYDSMTINNLTVETINGGSPSGGSTWSTYPAISDVTANLDSFGNPQYSISNFLGVRASNLTATSNVYASSMFATGSMIAVDVEAGSTMSVGTIAAHNGSFIVNGGTTLDGGTFHGTTIGSLPVSGVNTVRIDVLPIGIDMVSPTYITMEAGGAINIAAIGAASVAGGSYVELNSGSGDVRCISTSSGNDNTTLYTGKLTSGYSGSDPLRIFSSKGVQINNGTTWNTTTLNTNVNNSTQTSVKSYTTFDSYVFSNVYNPGDKVLFAGVDYTAVFITQGVDPSTNIAPNWVSGYTGYVEGSSVTSGTDAFSCKVNSPNTFEPPEINTDQWFSVGFAPHTWWFPTGDTKGEVLFTPNTGDTYTYAIVKPTETQNGLYIQKTNPSGVIVGKGLIYDSSINPPPLDPVITHDLNMNGYNILNTDNLYVNTLNGNGTSYLTMDADLYFYGGIPTKTISNVNILYTNQLVSNGSTIGIGSDLNATGVNLTGLLQVGTDTLSNGFSSNGILLGTTLKGNGQTIANVGAFSTATIGASTGNTSVGFTTNLNMNSNTISAVGTIGTNNISAPSGTITLQNNLNANSQNISGINFLYTSNLVGNGGGAIELGGNIAGNDFAIDSLGNVGTTNISGVSGSNVTMSTNLDMTGHSILNIANFPNLNTTNIHTDNIYALSGTTVTFHNDIVMAGTTEITGAYLITSDAINIDAIAAQRYTTIEVRNGFVMDGNDITSVGTLSATTLNGTDVNASTINADIYNSLNNAGITLGDDIYLNAHTLFGGDYASILNLLTISGTTLNITNILPYVGGADIAVGTNFTMNNHDVSNVGTLYATNVHVDNLTSSIGSGIQLYDSLYLNGNGLFGSGISAVYDMNVISGYSLQIDSIFPYTAGGDITLNTNFNMNGQNINNVNNLQLGGLYMSISDTALFYELRFDSLSIGSGSPPYYLQYSPDNISFTPVASDWSVFPAYGTLDMAGYSISNADGISSNSITTNTIYSLSGGAFPYATVQCDIVFGGSAGTGIGGSIFNLDTAYTDFIRPNLNSTTSLGKFSTGSVQQPMIQSGSGNTGTTYYQVTFPTAYTSNTYQVSLTYTQSPSGNTPIYVLDGSKTTTGFQVHGCPSQTFDWVSFGTSYT